MSVGSAVCIKDKQLSALILAGNVIQNKSGKWKQNVHTCMELQDLNQSPHRDIHECASDETLQESNGLLTTQWRLCNMTQLRVCYNSLTLGLQMHTCCLLTVEGHLFACKIRAVWLVTLVTRSHVTAMMSLTPGTSRRNIILHALCEKEQLILLFTRYRDSTYDTREDVTGCWRCWKTICVIYLYTVWLNYSLLKWIFVAIIV